jgi:dipeptidyl aminopeptidase/acylaminoacyl peptidase
LTNFETVRLGSPQWSPDGAFIAFDAYAEGRSAVHVAPVGGGPARRLTSGQRDAMRPAWSNDSQWIYYVAGGQISRIRRDGEGQSTLPFDGSQVREAPDGRSLLLLRGNALCRTSGGTVASEPIANGVGEGMWTVAGQYVYVHNRREITRYHAETRVSETVHTFAATEPEPPRGASLAVSPDERLILFPRLDRSERDIMLVENFGR